MIERKEDAKSARSVLLEDFNEIDVYVEDTAIESKKIYNQILKRVFNEKYKIEDIIPIGSCSKVIAEWAKHKLNNDNRPKVFIIDGDFVNLNNNLESIVPKELKDDIKGLYILPRYCIENYLFDENAFIEIIHDEDPVDEKEEIKSKLKFQEWVKSNEKLLADLFIIYSICIANNVPEKTINYKVTNLVSTNIGNVNNELVSNRIEYLKNKILLKDNSLDLEKEIEKRINQVFKCEQILLKFVSGKNYLFPLFKQHISTNYNIAVTQVSLKIRLAKQCDLSELENLTTSIM